jgi:hypothetical protein
MLPKIAGTLIVAGGVHAGYIVLAPSEVSSGSLVKSNVHVVPVREYSTESGSAPLPGAVATTHHSPFDPFSLESVAQ